MTFHSCALFLTDPGTGIALAALVDELCANRARKGVRYLIIIEGMASRDAMLN